MTFAVAWLALPPFVFEHLVVLLVIAAAVPWGLGAAVVAALVSVLADNVLLREPFGRPTVDGWRDIIDLILFASVAVVVSLLVRRAHVARLAAEGAARRERQARLERDRLIATVTHDLATPLAVLAGTVQFVRRGAASSPADVTRLLGRVETASARATSLVRMLADAQELDSDETRLDLRLVDVRTLVAPIVEMMDRFSERHPVAMIAPQTPVMVRADTMRLQRVLENLVSNAIKYSPDGGAVEVSIAVERGEVLLRVRDYGIGISPEALPHIFERAYRAPEAAAAAPGLGLGLSIAARAVARHGGSIDARPAEDRGAVVTVRLPLVDDDAVEASA
jgi:signal transduction histidine kinase